MKVLTLTAIIVAAFCLTSAQGQIVVTYVGSSTGATMPGSASDFIFFDAADYSFNAAHSEDNGTAYSELSSFAIAGGLTGSDGPGGDANITTPAGSLLQTGYLAASGHGGAYALEAESNPSFNYNDFDVYLMISNTNGQLNDTTVSLDPRENGVVTQFAHDATATDNSVSGNEAEYLEYNVTGLGTALAASGGNADLVVSMDGNIHNDPTNSQSYIGAVSFASVPEPSTYAMLLLGGVGLWFFVRRERARVSAK
jgi:hypothetical protein